MASSDPSLNLPCPYLHNSPVPPRGTFRRYPPWTPLCIKTTLLVSSLPLCLQMHSWGFPMGRPGWHPAGLLGQQPLMSPLARPDPPSDRPSTPARRCSRGARSAPLMRSRGPLLRRTLTLDTPCPPSEHPRPNPGASGQPPKGASASLAASHAAKAGSLGDAGGSARLLATGAEEQRLTRDIKEVTVGLQQAMKSVSMPEAMRYAPTRAPSVLQMCMYIVFHRCACTLSQTSCTG